MHPPRFFTKIMNAIFAQTLFLVTRPKWRACQCFLTSTSDSDWNMPMFEVDDMLWSNLSSESAELIEISLKSAGVFAISKNGSQQFEGDVVGENLPWNVPSWVSTGFYKDVSCIQRTNETLMVEAISVTNGRPMPVPWQDMRGTHATLNAVAVNGHGVTMRNPVVSFGGCTDCMSRILLTFPTPDDSDVIAAAWVNGGPPTLYSDDGVTVNAQAIYIDAEDTPEE